MNALELIEELPEMIDDAHFAKIADNHFELSQVENDCDCDCVEEC